MLIMIRVNIVTYLCRDQNHSCCVYSNKWWFKTQKKSKKFIVLHNFALELNIILAQFPPLKIVQNWPILSFAQPQMNLDKFQCPYGKRWKGKNYFQLLHLEDC
jgi:hypothetical protein